MVEPLPEDLYSAFLKQSAAHALWEPDDRLLVAVSGGPDSVVLADLTRQTGQLAGLVHVNYHLRGHESDADEELVRTLSERWRIPFHLLESSTEELASMNGLSTQMAARQVRYSWWESLVADGAGSCLLTAHHADDQLETILLHWLRGTGLTGWMGIPGQRAFLRRPLLPFAKATLIAYAAWAGLQYRTDRSNLETHYKRNRIRHHVVPELLAIQPELHQVAEQQAEDVRHVLQAADWAVQALAEKYISRSGDQFRIDLLPLRECSFTAYAFYKWLHPLGFSRDQLRSIQEISSPDHGQRFLSTDWEAVVDRGHLICRQRQQTARTESFQVTLSTSVVDLRAGRLIIEQVQRWAESDLDDPNILILDPQSLNFPMVIRTWSAGDRMKLPGLPGRKKIREILAEQKTDPFTKEIFPVLCQEIDQHIIWLPGIRISSEVALPAPGSKALKMTWIPSGY